MILVNCDIGERGAAHPEDAAIMPYLHIANIACGGHAGDRASIEWFTKQADELGVQISAHLSYPDSENFGRLSMQITDAELLATLDEQHNRMPNVKTIKLHGALYNDAAVNPERAELLVGWAKNRGFDCIIAPDPSEMAKAAKAAHLRVLAEVFAERNYQLQNGQLILVPRKLPHASIHNLDAALAHSKQIIEHKTVSAYLNEEGDQQRECPVQAETICIHSDSAIALPLAKALSTL